MTTDTTALRALPKADRGALTPREREIVVLLGKGFENREIGRLLELSRHTVSDHLKLIFAKLDVSNRVEAAVWACKQGWL